MATIRTLSVSVTAQTEAFERGMKRMRKELKAVGRDVADAGRVVGTFGIAVAAAGAAGLTLLVKNAMETIDATAKLSDRMGIATETLIGFQHAAELGGVSAEELRIGLETMLKGVSAGTDPGAAFKSFADEIVALNDPVAQAQRAVEIFGKSGQRLLPILLEGSAGLNAAAAEAERLGISFSRVDAGMVERANDALTNVKNVFKGIGISLAVELAPLIEAAAKLFTDWATSGEGMGSKVTAALQGAVNILAQMADGLSVVISLYKHAMSYSAGLQADYARAQLSRAKTNEDIRYYRQLLRLAERDNTNLLQESQKAWEDFTNGRYSRAVTDTYNKIKSEAKMASEAAVKNRAPDASAFKENFKADTGFFDMDKEISSMFGDIHKINEKNMKSLADRAQKFRDAIVDPVDEIKAKIEEANDLFRKGGITAAEAAKGLSALIPQTAQEAGPGTFRQVDTSRLSVEGLSRQAQQKQSVVDEDNKKQNTMIIQLLKSAVDKLGPVGVFQ